MAFKATIPGIILRVRLAPNQVVGRNVGRLRNKAGLTQEELAEKAEISRGFLQEIEKGAKNPTINVITRLKRALRCTWFDLLQGID